MWALLAVAFFSCFLSWKVFIPLLAAYVLVATSYGFDHANESSWSALLLGCLLLASILFMKLMWVAVMRRKRSSVPIKRTRKIVFLHLDLGLGE